MSGIGSNLKLFATWALTSLLDSAFLVFWVILQFLTNRTVAQFELSGIDVVVFWIFQVVFAISTVAPVLLYVYKDVVVMILQAKHELARAKKDYSAS